MDALTHTHADHLVRVDTVLSLPPAVTEFDFPLV